MTSTSINVGLNEAPKLSSRVLRPPGGGHTDIFGGDPEPPRGRRRAEACGGQQVQQAAPQAPAETAKPEPAPEAAAPVAEQQAPPKEEKPAAPVAQKPAEAPSAPSRVRVPPGGFSSGLW